MKKETTNDKPLLHPRTRAITIAAWDYILEDCHTIGKCIGRVETLSKRIKNPNQKYLEGLYFDKTDEDGANCFKGDFTEILAEHFFDEYGPTVGVNDYSPLIGQQDTGVDGEGKTKDIRPVLVQVKWGRWNEKVGYIQRGLGTFHLTSLRENIGQTSTDQIFLFTLADGVDWRTIDFYFHGRLKFIARNFSTGIISKQPIEKIFSLETLIGDNPLFFKLLYERILKS